MQPDRSLDHLYPAFASKVRDILDEATTWCEVHYPGHTAALAEGYRSTQRQQELFAQGRTAPGQVVTEKNGTTNPSNHQSCLAADIVPQSNLGLEWPPDDHPFWAYLQHLAHTEGLTSGSDWHSFVDRPHVEWPESDTATYQDAKDWKMAQGLP